MLRSFTLIAVVALFTLITEQANGGHLGGDTGHGEGGGDSNTLGDLNCSAEDAIAQFINGAWECSDALTGLVTLMSFRIAFVSANTFNPAFPK